jgi:hypothetical protein
VKRVLLIAGIVVVALAACIGLITVLTSRDSSQVNETSGPGTLEPDRGSERVKTGPATPASPPDRPPTSGNHREVHVLKDQIELSDDQILDGLQSGNVIIT